MAFSGWFEGWGWEPGRYKVVLIGLVGIPVLVLPVAFQFMELRSLWPLAIPILLGSLHGVVYGIVGRQVVKTRRGDSPDMDVTDCIIATGMLQSPATAVLGEKTLTLRPIIGKNYVIELDRVTGIRESHRFNGSGYLLKRGFILDVTGIGRIGFAVTNTIAKRWRPALLQMAPGSSQGDNVR